MTDNNAASSGEFNADEFLAASFSNNFESKLELVPKGDYPGIIEKVDNARKISPNDSSKKPFGTVDVTFVLDAPEISAQLNREPLRMKMQMFLDLDASGKLDGGKNRNLALGRLQDACGVTAPWSWTDFVGKGPLTCKVDHEEDRRDNELPYEQRRRYERVVAVTKRR